MKKEIKSCILLISVMEVLKLLEVTQLVSDMNDCSQTENDCCCLCHIAFVDFRKFHHRAIECAFFPVNLIIVIKLV